MEKPPNNQDANEWDRIDEERKHLWVFGRDVAEIPCFRNSFLYGIGSGFGVGLGTFMFSSRPAFSAHVAYSTFFATTLGYWLYCRYDYSKTKFLYSQVKKAMREQAIYEGTHVEDELKRQTKEA